MKYIFTKGWQYLLVMTACLLTAYVANAQYTSTQLEKGRYYVAMAKDQQNNIYDVRYNGSSYEVVKYAGGNFSAATVIYSGLSLTPVEYPWGLAVNQGGDVFVTNPDVPSHWQIIKLTYNSGSNTYTPAVIHSGNYYSALAVDHNNNLIALEYNSTNDAYRLVRYTAGSEAAAGTAIYEGVPYGNSTYPWGLAADSHNNIYVTDYIESSSNGRLYRINAADNSVTPIATENNVVFTSLTIDDNDNVYAVKTASAAISAVVKYTAPVTTGQAAAPVFSGLTNGSLFYPWGIVVNNTTQEVYVNDGAYVIPGAPAGQQGQILKLSPPTAAVSSVTRAAASPTNAASVTYTVSFSNNVTNVTTGAFALTTTGISGAAITNVSGSGNTYTVTVNTGSGDGTLLLTVPGTGVSPTLTNVPYTSGETYTIDKTAPDVTLAVNNNAAYTNNPAVNITLTTTDATTGLQMRFSNDGTNWSSWTAFATNAPWTLTGAEGLKTVYAQVKDPAGNITSQQKQITLDLTAPGISFTQTPPALSNNTSVSFGLTSNEAGAVFEASFDGGAYTSVSSPVTYTGITQGPHTFSARAIDGAGNVSTAPATYNFTIDLTSPQVTSVTVPANGYYKQGDQLAFTVHFSENVVITGTPALTLVIGQTTRSATYTSGSGSNALVFRYTVQAGEKDLDGISLNNTLDLSGSTIADAAGNAAPPALNNAGSTTGVLVYAIVPTVSLSSTAPGVVNAPFTLDVYFSEAVTGLTISDFVITNAALSNLYTNDNTHYTLTVTPLAEGVVNLQLPAGKAVNIAGTGNSASGVLQFTYDVTAPSVTQVQVPANGTYAAGSQLSFTVQFTEPVTVSTTGGTPSLALIIGSSTKNAEYTGGNGSNSLSFSYTVENGDLDNNGITLQNLLLNGARIQDAAGNNATLTLNNTGNTSSVLVDAVAPTVQLVSVPANGYYRQGNQLSFIVHMSEAVTVTGTPVIDIQLNSGTVAAQYTGGSGSSALAFVYTVQPGDNDMDGIALGNTIGLNGATIKDAATNTAQPALNNTGNTTGIFVNTTVPTVSLSSAAPALVNAPFTVDITFSEAVTELTLSDFTATNASLGSLQTSDNVHYTLMVTPVADGTVSLQLPANTAVNIAGNGNSASNVLQYTYDGTAPVISAVTVPAGGYYKTGDVLDFTVQFSEPVTVNTTQGSPSLGITVGTAARQALYTAGTGSNMLQFRYTVQATDEDLDGITLASTLALNGGVIQDQALNQASLVLHNTGNTSGVFVYSAVPAVMLSGIVAVNKPFTVTVTFSEAVSGFSTAGITAVNAVISNLQTSDNIVYTALVTPAADGAVSLQVKAGAASNIGGTANTASNTLSYSFDATAPTISGVDVPPNGYYTSGSQLVFTVHFTENVKLNATVSAPALGITIGQSVVQAVYTGGSGSTAFTFSYTVKESDMDNDGITVENSLQPNGATLTDDAGNAAVLTLHNIANTLGVRVNTAHPGAVIAAVTPDRVNKPVVVTLTFSEPVSGLTAASIQAVNATVSALQSTDNTTYTALVTPAADGIVSVQVPANSVHNIAGNGNTPSNTASFTYDATAPVITAGQQYMVTPVSPAGTVAGSIKASESAGSLQNWMVVTDESGGAFSLDNSGTIVVKEPGLLGSLAGKTVTLTVTVSDGLNTSLPAPVRILIGSINQAPSLDAIADVTICANTDEHQLQLTGASAGETGQTYSFTVTANKPLFSLLTVDAAGVLHYRLNSNATGQVLVTVTIKDNGGTAYGGVDSLQRPFTLTVNSVPAVSITSDKGTSISKGDIVHLTASGGDTYSWSNAGGIIGGTQSSMLEARPLTNTSYQVTAVSAAGCSSTASIAITVAEDFKIDATNILTPNGDGKNDKWVIRNIDAYTDNEVRVFDRAGRMVYHKKGYNNDWDATSNGTVLAEGTYYYIVTINGGAKTAKGYITIIRDRH